MSRCIKKNGESQQSPKVSCLVVAIASGLLMGACTPEAAEVTRTGTATILRTELNKPWPAPVAPASELPAPELPLRPEDALKTLTLPPGYQLELVASEPLVQDPILAEFDGDGRLWVLEMSGFAYHEDMANSFEPISKLVILEDTTGDTVFDKRTVFMDQLIMPRAFKILDSNCALVGAPPNLFHACDLDGDLVADTREIVNDTFSVEGVVEHGANGLYWALDNTLYVSQHDWNLKRSAEGFYTVPSLNRGQWGITQDSVGRTYRNVNTEPLFVDYISPDYYARNPNLIRTSGLYANLVDQAFSAIWPARPTPGLNRGYREGSLREDGSAIYYAGVSSPMIYRGDRLPEELHEQAFVVDSPTNIVHLLKLEDDGSGNLSARDFYERGEFIASTDERFRPVQIVNGWDGAIYVIDMYRGVSQDGPLQTDYLRSYINERRLWEHINLGRIYRVVHTGWTPDEKPSMSTDSTSQLIGHLSHPNGWWRDTAQQLLVQRADPEAVSELRSLALNSDNQHARLHALWTLSGLEDSGVIAVDLDTVFGAIQDDWWAMRAAGLRLSERWLRQGHAEVLSAAKATMNDEHWQVRRQLAATLGELPEDLRIDLITEVLRLYGDQDTVLVDVAISGLLGIEDRALELWLSDADPHPDVAGMLAGAVAKNPDVETTQQLIATIMESQHSDELRREMLIGLTQGLEGADGRGGGVVVAGGLAGRRVPGMVRPSAPVIRIDLPEEPVALTSLAESDSGLAEAARYAAAVMGWPGKPRDVGRDRTADEEQLFQAGSGIYASVCAGCHGQEGMGTPIGLPLGGAPFVTGDPNIVTRILLHGKEGEMGLMPPQSMSDEQLASVITYIRGSFGNIADPVNEVSVREFRQAFSHRTTPWTTAELEIPQR